MSNVVVYVFLLDNLSGFSGALNETVQKKRPSLGSLPAIRPCDPDTTNQILNVVTNELELDVPAFMTNSDNTISVYDDSREALYKTLIEDLPDMARRHDFYEKAIDTFDFDSIQDHQHINVHNVMNFPTVTTYFNVTKYPNVTIYRNVTNFPHDINFLNDINFQNDTYFSYVTNFSDVTNKHDVTNIPDSTNILNVTQIPNWAPFLVAIFETMSNVTAQTCAGTLISPRWVLTAASCVNILSNLYTDDKNVTRTTSETLYTIVAGGLNPLTDGSTHNVTSVLVQPNVTISSNFTRVRKSLAVELQSPYLAMMKIEPEYDGGHLSLIGETVTRGEVTIYGWTLVKNDSGLDAMILVKLSAQILSEAECQAMYSFFSNDIICLLSNDTFRNIRQLSSGGPVLVQQGVEAKLLAVVQTDDNILIAYPLHMHIDRIKDILNT